MKIYTNSNVMNKLIIAEITIEVHLINELKINILIGVDVLVLEKITFNFTIYIITISIYKI